jgi:hypothetical protein
MTLNRKLSIAAGTAVGGPVGAAIGAGLYDMKKSTDKVNKEYEDSKKELDNITKANTGEAGNQKAQMMANQGAMAAGNTTGESAASAAKAAGMNSEAADAVGGNVANTATQNAFTNEYNKALESNQQEIAEDEQRVNEANKRRAEKGEANSKILGTAGALAGTAVGAAVGGPVGAAIGGGLGGSLGSLGGSAITSDANCKEKWLIDSISNHRKSILKNDRLRNREYE